MTYDPVQMGQLLKARYPQAYGSYPDEVVGQRWIDKNVPKPTTGAGSGAGDILQGPTGTAPTTSTDSSQNVPQFGNGNDQLYNTMQPGKNQSQQVPLLGSGVTQNTNSGSSATMSAPQSKPAIPSAPSFTSHPLPANSPIRKLPLYL